MTDTKKGGLVNRPKTNNVSANHSTDLWDAVKAFQNTMQQQGLGLHNVGAKVDAGIQRGRNPDDKKGTKNVYWEFFSLPIPAGYFGDWKRGIYETWCFKQKKELTHAERKAFAIQLEEAKKRRKQEQEKRYEKARKRALTIWNGCYPASSTHPYAKAKRMGTKGLRQGRAGLVVPLYQNKQLSTLQFINDKGGKKFLSGGKIKGSYFVWGNLKKPFDTVYVAEGISSGFAVHVLADYAPVFCAMNANNLKNVACSIRRKWVEKVIVIAADNDVREDNNAINTGVKSANEAATACGGRVSIPQMPDGSKCDWNDLYVLALDKGGDK